MTWIEVLQNYVWIISLAGLGVSLFTLRLVWQQVGFMKERFERPEFDYENLRVSKHREKEEYTVNLDIVNTAEGEAKNVQAKLHQVNSVPGSGKTGADFYDGERPVELRERDRMRQEDKIPIHFRLKDDLADMEQLLLQVKPDNDDPQFLWIDSEELQSN